MSTTRKSTKAASDAATEATKTAQAAVNDGIERMTQGMSKIGSFGQENVEAMIECATTVAKGVEKIAAENVEYAKSQMDAGTDKFQALSKAKTPQEFFEAQSELFRTSMEQHIGQVNKVSDMWVAAARDAAQPLSKRYSAFVEMMQTR
ncbi:phasin family protein [Parvularcula marina]|uniref:Phasin family protein n=1 Tax=Parvularcula marina TaxID=2292771 RepID=A0A371R7P7_9PROT|nr:phasin family protein [Parvularcula marina]RFB01448.1 phasin family protein [Parvularcula marina]